LAPSVELFAVVAFQDLAHLFVERAAADLYRCFAGVGVGANQ
jgi:hypothetical protein